MKGDKCVGTKRPGMREQCRGAIGSRWTLRRERGIQYNQPSTEETSREGDEGATKGGVELCGVAGARQSVMLKGMLLGELGRHLQRPDGFPTEIRRNPPPMTESLALPVLGLYITGRLPTPFLNVQ